MLLNCGLSQRVICLYLPSIGQDSQDALDPDDPTTQPLSHGAQTDERRREQRERIVVLRHDGWTWPQIATTVGLSRSRVRAIYAGCGPVASAPVPVADAEILANLRLFIAACAPHAASRRSYARWPERVVAPATIAHRFGSWANAMAQARGTQLPRDDAAMLASLRAYTAATGKRPTSRTYDRWAQRLVAHRAIAQRFGSWQRAVDLACRPSDGSE